MPLSAAQIKGQIRNIAKKNNADARVLLRIYAMERFLERMANSEYRDNFVLKGGVLVTAMVGVAQRSTMDIDTTLRNHNLSLEEAEDMMENIIKIKVDDEVTFQIKAIENIMDEMEYAGIRAFMNAKIENMIVPFKVDISTGDVITPRAIKYDYELLLENRSISLWSYNLETVISEKLQTILARNVLNTRMRDYYDVYILLRLYRNKVDRETLKNAFAATCHQRGTEMLLENADEILLSLEQSEAQRQLWQMYQKKYPYAADTSFDEVLNCVWGLTQSLQR